MNQYHPMHQQNQMHRFLLFRLRKYWQLKE